VKKSLKRQQSESEMYNGSGRSSGVSNRFAAAYKKEQDKLDHT
jgi:hypothetical protein